MPKQPTTTATRPQSREGKEGIPEGPAGFRISSAESLGTPTTASRQLAGLYFYFVLDCLIELAHEISKDFFARPQLYNRLGEPAISATLARLNSQYGNDEHVPSREQRAAIFRPLFGQDRITSSDGSSDFTCARDPLIAACVAFAERVYDTGVVMLEDSVRSAHRPFRDLLLGSLGDSVQWSREQSFGEIADGLAYPILRHPGISRVFGIGAPGPAWPYTEDPNGAVMVEQASRQLPFAAEYDGPLSRARFNELQRLALRGAEAVASVLETPNDARETELLQLITAVYTWGSALTTIRRN
jgi:hypothetical protein